MNVKSNLNPELLRTASIIHSELGDLLREMAWVVQDDNLKVLDVKRTIIDLTKKYDKKVEYLDFILDKIEE